MRVKVKVRVRVRVRVRVLDSDLYAGSQLVTTLWERRWVRG